MEADDLNAVWERLYSKEQILAIVKALPSNSRVRDALNQVLTAGDRYIFTRVPSLMILVLGMAKAKFHYDPTVSRRSAAGNISKALAIVELKMDDDTVRKWLRVAFETLSQS